MVIRNIDQVPMKPVQMAGANGATMAVMVGREDGVPNFALRQFQVEGGGNTPRHSHDYEHEVFIVSGGAPSSSGRGTPRPRGRRDLRTR
ncbi:MAG: hypothetical protein IPJ41_10985 [Phycisphaerales bacterium]|nr:hypothetical protein [Phycisphaerales bacterium]